MTTRVGKAYLNAEGQWLEISRNVGFGRTVISFSVDVNRASVLLPGEHLPAEAQGIPLTEVPATESVSRTVRIGPSPAE